MELRHHFNDLMARTGGAAAPGFPIVSCKLYSDKNYAFVEFRTVEEASNCMALDGVQFGETHLRVSSSYPCHAFIPLLHASERGMPAWHFEDSVDFAETCVRLPTPPTVMQVRRPNNYASHIAAVLGPQTPDPSIDLSSLNIVKTVVPDSPNKLFIGGLPCDWTEDQVGPSLSCGLSGTCSLHLSLAQRAGPFAVQVKELLHPFGELRAFNLVMDKTTGNSKVPPR